MAHDVKVRAVPHQNKDGNLSKTKKDWIVSCRSRGKDCYREVCKTRSAALEVVEDHRATAYAMHLLGHPNDTVFKNKHIKPVEKEVNSGA